MAVTRGATQAGETPALRVGRPHFMPVLHGTCSATPADENPAPRASHPDSSGVVPSIRIYPEAVFIALGGPNRTFCVFSAVLRLCDSIRPPRNRSRPMRCHATAVAGPLSDPRHA
jgi:hypothetical protein